MHKALSNILQRKCETCGNYDPTYQFPDNLENVFLSRVDLVLIASDDNFIRIRAFFVWELDPHTMIVTDLVDRGSFASNDVWVVLWLNIQSDREAA